MGALGEESISGAWVPGGRASLYLISVGEAGSWEYVDMRGIVLFLCRRQRKNDIRAQSMRRTETPTARPMIAPWPSEPPSPSFVVDCAVFVTTVPLAAVLVAAVTVPEGLSVSVVSPALVVAGMEGEVGEGSMVLVIVVRIVAAFSLVAIVE